MDRFEAIYNELEDIDLIRGLTDRSLHVSRKGLEWVPTPSPESFGLSKEQFIELYRYMKCTRALDQKIRNLTRTGRAFGKHLMSVGNEASAVGAAYALEKRDWMTVAIRDLGAFIVRGTFLETILAQSCARASSPTGGWDAGLHMSDREHRTLGIISHLGVMLPVATGLGFAEKYFKQRREEFKKTGRAVLAFLGEGATSTGDVHEALIIASRLYLPLVVVIEDNQYAFGTPKQLQFMAKTLALRALGYGPHVEGYFIDGTNVLTVYGTVKEALQKARNDFVITIIHDVSMRYEGHSLNDHHIRDGDKGYVPQKQMALWKEKDPLLTYPRFLLEKGILTEDMIKKIDDEIFADIEKAEEVILRTPPPSGANIERKVFSPSPTHPTVMLDPPETGRRITYHDAIRESMREEMDQNENILLIGEDIGISGGAFKITEGFSKRYDGIDWEEWWDKKEIPAQRRVIDAPLAEEGFMGLAAGAAIHGLWPIVEFQYADFVTKADCMIKNYIATQTVRGLGPLHLVLRLPNGWAESAGPYHAVNAESLFIGTPGLKIVAPITSFDAKGLLKAAIRDGNPVLFLEYKHCYRIRPEHLPPELNTPVPESDYIVPIGKARILKKGEALTIVTYGSQVFRVLNAVRNIEKEKKDTSLIEVIDLRSIIPWDTAYVCESVKKTGRVLISCEAPKTGSFVHTIASFLMEHMFQHLDAPIMTVAALDTPVPFAKELEDAHLPTEQKLIQKIQELLAY